MSSTCPACNDGNVQRLSAAYGGGGSAVKADANGEAGGSGGGVNPVKSLPRGAAPPAKASYLRILIVWFIAIVAAPFVFLTLQMSESAGRYISYGISILTAYALLRAYSYNKTQWPQLFERWEHSWVCLHCGKIFQR